MLMPSNSLTGWISLTAIASKVWQSTQWHAFQGQPGYRILLIILLINQTPILTLTLCALLTTLDHGCCWHCQCQCHWHWHRHWHCWTSGEHVWNSNIHDSDWEWPNALPLRQPRIWHHHSPPLQPSSWFSTTILPLSAHMGVPGTGLPRKFCQFLPRAIVNTSAVVAACQLSSYLHPGPPPL